MALEEHWMTKEIQFYAVHIISFKLILNLPKGVLADLGAPLINSRPRAIRRPIFSRTKQVLGVVLFELA